MPARAVARALLACLLGGLAVTALTSPGSAGQAPPEVIVSARTVCGETRAEDRLEITIVNPGAQTYQVQIDVHRAIGQDESIPVTLDPGETETVAVPVFGTPMDVFVSGDLDFPDQQLDPVFNCPVTVDVTYTTTQDTPVEIQFPCSMGDLDLANGFVEATSNFTGVWTPDPGFVGEEATPYSCPTSFEQEGTMTFVVTPAQVPPAEPVPEEPTFTG